MLRPKLFDTLRTYTWEQFKADVISGAIVGVVALPLAIAFAIASGVSPDRGLITAIVAGFIISALGGSKVQIGGPTGAFVVLVYAIVQEHGIDGLMAATMMAGLILVVMGLMGFGAVIKFIPYPVTIGFTSGIAVIIFTSQIKDFFGLQIGDLPASFIGKMTAYAQHFWPVNFYALGIALGTVLIILIWQNRFKKIPGSVVALAVATAAVALFHLPVETIGSRFGDIPDRLPFPSFPRMDWAMIEQMAQPAISIAILGAIESLLSAVVADGMIGGRHRSNMELIAQGVANVASPLFGGMPATGAIARTAVNVHNGGRTPVAGMVHAVSLFMIMVFFGRWAKLIPMPALAGILAVVSYRMAEWHSFRAVLKAPRSDAVVMLVTFGLTVVLDLTVAIQAGMGLAAFLFINRMAQNATIPAITGAFVDEEERDEPDALHKKTIPQGVEVYEINGPFFFGMVSTFIETMNNLEKSPKVRILRMRHVSSIDATAINALRQVVAQSKKWGVLMIFSGVSPQLYGELEKSGIVDLVEKQNILSNIDKALARAVEAIEHIKKGRA